MFVMGHENWVKYGWGPELKDDWFLDAQLEIDWSVSSLSSMTALRAGIYTAQTIAAHNPGPYTLMCSGGIDSQAMAYAWKLSGIPFRIVSVRYVSNGILFNEHDLSALDGEIKDFDIIHFLENDLEHIAKVYDCQSPQICCHIKMSELIEEGTIIFSGNFLQNSLTSVHSSLNYTTLGLQRYADKSIARKIIPSFFSYTPELAYAFMSEKKSDIPSSVLYLEAGYQINNPLRKYNGFERLKIDYDSKSHLLTKVHKLKAMNKPSHRVFDLIFRYPLEDNRKVNSAIVINKINFELLKG